ncbi:ABC transporter permease [Micrococcales bacterium 31B]|nr:ABC transporter permease [Micrococcales bacterium 31B]
MTFADILRTAAKNAFRSKLRTTLTVLSLVVGAFTLTLTTALGTGVNDYVTRQVATLGSSDVLLVSPAATTSTNEGPPPYEPDGRQTSGANNPLASGALLNQRDLDSLGRLDGIKRVQPITQVKVDWIQATGATEKFETTINPTSSVGRNDLLAGAQLQQQNARREIVIPEDFVSALGFADPASAVGQNITLGFQGYSQGTLATQEVDATIVGVSRSSLFASGAGANAALTSAIAEEQTVPGQPKSWPLAVAYLTGTGEGGAVTAADVNRVKSELTTHDLAGQTLEDQLGIIQTVINGIVGVLSAFSVVALVAASFGIINTLLMSVQERTREIGLMKAMGMPNGRVFALFSLEAILIGLLGSALGALVAIGAGTAISSALSQTALADLPGLSIMLFDPVKIGGVIVLITLIAFLSGVLPARRAARQDPIASLRYE